MTTAHVVTRPQGGRHQDLRLMTDVELLPADTIASVRMGQRGAGSRAAVDAGGVRAPARRPTSRPGR
mgnify:CR=1 FL=1